MKTALAWLVAATALSCPCAHAASIGQDGADAGVQVTESIKQSLYEAAPAETIPTLPTALQGFYGVDLSATSLAAKSAGAHALRSPHDHLYQDSRASTPGAGAAIRTTPVLPAEQEGVPEPGTVAILSVGLAGLVLASRKKA
ncbi:PEP-CTERM sorting domain-containing protein [Massilia sp. SYSU DXS3249]